MSILPSINLDTQEVTLNVRPTLTRRVGDAPNPQTGFLRSIATTPANAALIPEITVPIIESREIDSITKIKSGGVMVIGGLMEDTSANTETGAPGVGEIPVFGNLFKSRSETSSKRELIIFIKATIVNSDGSAHKSDQSIYDKFTTDPRPLFNP
jgi:general secretion pathway protein D